MAVLDDLLEDLAAESAVLDALVTPLDPDAWRAQTPAPGWTIGHQIAHLAWTDRVAGLAARDPAEFNAMLTRALQEGGAGFVDQEAERGARLAPAELLAAWRADRHELVTALAAVPPGQKLPWFGPPMGAATMATARLMETWAHGQDVADALDVKREPTARLRNVAHLGVRTRDFAFIQRGLQPPTAEFRIELTAPDGSVWTWGPQDAAERVTGPALDFCLLVAQRRHRGDLAVRADGAAADAWLDIAQVFAGPSGPGRSKGQFA
ncbi:TIGR03084 family protein [Catenulispora sp. NF23]|uniref:TIGR03084 family protein n=1 Tax=Catenulispora pinistramenti TaxID=2705254 RepID=A0ABS5KZZ0_9ACTN|nr:TIGR03084 family metal-binding protein [Catenulispora pinistramenti]MBS2535024.1 TIGR03084 family protein [Catenulispora pinistramenti]MBS2551618.1 TIGR03084 family protein [Catenulispora pinistramenti]